MGISSSLREFISNAASFKKPRIYSLVVIPGKPALGLAILDDLHHFDDVISFHRMIVVISIGGVGAGWVSSGPLYGVAWLLGQPLISILRLIVLDTEIAVSSV